MALLQQQNYETLNEVSAAKLAKKLHLFHEDAELTSSEIGDGNLNLVFRVKDQLSGKSVIIKQALPYAKVVGESWPLTLKRAKIEADALKLFRELAPEFVPEVYFSDETFAITVMEDLSHLSIARTGLIQGEEYPLISKHLGKYLAKTLFLTSDFGLEPSDKKELVQKFINPELCKITEDLVFTDPFFDSETNSFEEELIDEVKKLWSDEKVKLETALLKQSFLTEAESLLHGDLHTGSIFASKTETKVIDPEFAFYGPAGFDLGQVIANLLFQAIANEGKQEGIFSHIRTFWKTFTDEYSSLWTNSNKEPFSKTDGYLEKVLKKYFKDMIGFAGCELIRRTIGLAHVADLDGIDDQSKRIHAKIKTLNLGKKLIVSRERIRNIDELISNIKDNLK
ncbi:S-methyl-5-thioribose kinase [Bacillus methanolicus]|uniref:Methylthioribose kinase n=1 Tax=Bacillus methanolicus (strain MGA3 / ATCC 53907) TaxID=796606 RepID=I3E801_BACMM|nr:S-methyl-5-thioribose kinase [Bacillus methanolicus]AIE59438.1 Methylthioribose kinase [Bacillus methanolicus MGA3]EIJ82622.1 methylthioribose kinase [Bacillus methanolicus MGA3]UQD51506.1 S-methyl-5-thioribose kinase [Bacillus methanolicus]